MSNPIYPCLWFDNQAKAAASFYCNIFQHAKITTENPIVVNFDWKAKNLWDLMVDQNIKSTPLYPCL